MAASREKLIRNAEKFVSRGRIEAAIREYRKILADQPRDTGTLNRVGDLYARINDIGEAVRLFTQIAEQYTEEGFFVKAIAIYKKIIKLDPTRLGVYEQLANLYHRQGLVTEARTQYQVLADYYLKHDNSASAISIIQQMAELEPDDPAHRAKLAELYQQEKLNDKAMAQYQLIADVMLGHDRVDQAVQVLQRGLEISPADANYLGRAVNKLRNAGQEKAARQLLNAVADTNPAAAGLLETLGGEEPEEAAGEEAEEVASDAWGAAGAPAEEPSDTGWLSGEDRDGEVALGDPGVVDADDLLGGQDDDLARAMAEAEAAVGPEDAPATPADDEDEVLLDWDETSSESLIAPPPDMLEKGPDVAGSGFSVGLEEDDEEGEAQQAREARDEEEASVGLEGDGSTTWEIDLADLDLGEVELEGPEEASAEPAPGSESVSADGLELDRAAGSAGRTSSADLIPDGAFDLSTDFSGLGEAPPEADEGPPETSFDDMLSEAEVLSKYGLKEKAFERVEQVLAVDSGHLGAHRVLIQLHLEDGNEEEVRRLAEELRRLSDERGDQSEWEMVEERFAMAGFALEKEKKGKKKPPPKKAVEPKRPTGDRIDRLLASLVDDVGTPSKRRKEAEKAADKLLAGLVPDRSRRPKAAAPARPEGAQGPPSQGEPPRTEAPAEPPPPVAPGAPRKPTKVNLDDHSDIDDALSGMSPIAGIPTGPPSVPQEAPRESSFNEDTGTSWLDEVEAQRLEDDPTGGLFEQEEGFFDLAAELEEELTVSDALGEEPAGEQTLEEIVEGFKQGVAEHLSEEDYGTHFDLGIAYREMGLLDEAIGEFQVAAKDPGHLVTCCSMLGICFLDKGLPELAVKWYTRGLSAPNVSEEDSLALLFDLGAAYQVQGDDENARKTFVEVYGINSGYRDVAARLKQLQQG